MEGKQEFSKQVDDHSVEWVRGLEQAGMTVAESLSRVVSTVEAIAQSVSKFFDTVKQQKDTVVELGHSAGAKIRPMTQTSMKVLNKGRVVSHRLVSKSRENPVPFIMGGVAIVGGLALLAYYLREDRPAAEGGIESASDHRSLAA